VIAYSDSSVVVAWLLRQPGAIEYWKEYQRVVASDLLRVELMRALDQLRITRALTDEELARMVYEANAFLGACEIVAVDKPVLDRAAAPFATVVRTLDAVHLSTALLWIDHQRRPLTFLTVDRQLAAAAIASGLEVRPR
jgi:predicted nucleic acid-binding protein